MFISSHRKTRRMLNIEGPNFGIKLKKENKGQKDMKNYEVQQTCK